MKKLFKKNVFINKVIQMKRIFCKYLKKNNLIMIIIKKLLTLMISNILFI